MIISSVNDVFNHLSLLRRVNLVHFVFEFDG